MQSHTHNTKHLQPLRRALRRDSTPQEMLLWSRLRGGQLGFRFRRQHSVGNVILDFYCPAKKLAIELDGSQHMEKENESNDRTRTAYLQRMGIRVLRFGNNEVKQNIPGVLEEIMRVIQSTSPRPSPV